MFRRFKLRHWAVLLGAALQVGAMVGLYVHSTASAARDDGGGAILRQVYPTLPPFVTATAPEAATTGATATTAATAGAEAILPPAVEDHNAFLVPLETASPAGAETPPVPASTLAPPATPESTRQPLAPTRIVIPAIGLDAPVIPSYYQLVSFGGQVFQQWEAPSGFQAGWQTSSAGLGVPGNTVLNGHHNIAGEVFGGLVNLQPGDAIEMYSGDARFDYVVTNKMILPERDQTLSVRLENARWLEDSADERLTLVTCWPWNSNTHRLIVVAKPVGK